jgi:hypothetical protein
MESNKNLSSPENPFYEAFTSEDAALIKMVLKEEKSDFTELGNESLISSCSQRYFVLNKDDEWMNKKKYEIKKAIANGHGKAQFEYERDIYFRLFKK